jgi:DUF1009 family protein
MMPTKLGILAGRGELPRRVIAACQRADRPCFVLAFNGQTDPETTDGVAHAWVRLGAAGEGLAALRAAGVTDVVMAGAIRRPSIPAMRPDARMAHFLAKAGAAALRGDNDILAAAVRELEDVEGFRVVPLESVLHDVMVPLGPLGQHAPDAAAWDDIRRGVQAARALGVLDVGQGVVVQGGLVLAVEAIEGTDAMLARAAGLRRDGPGGVLVKMVKPAQERRADLPTIGVATVEAAHRAGLRGIAIEADGAVVVGRAETVARADALGLFMVGVEPGPES